MSCKQKLIAEKIVEHGGCEEISCSGGWGLFKGEACPLLPRHGGDRNRCYAHAVKNAEAYLAGLLAEGGGRG